jgi:TonB family protein
MTTHHALTLLIALSASLTQSDSTPRRVGGDVSPPIKIRNAFPAYPERLKLAGVQDIVFLDTTIDVEGAVANITPLRGVPQLVETAVAAVRKWRFTPTRLNGEPVEVVMTVSVAFFVAGRPRAPVIADVLRDPNELVRIKTIEYLSHSTLEKSEILTLLRQAQRDNVPAVRDAAEIAILTVQSRGE